MRPVLQFCACFALGLVVAALLLIGLMFCGQFDLIDGLLLSGKPLAGLVLWALPEPLWNSLTGLAEARRSDSLRSFLALCAALGQCSLVMALGFFRLWHRP
ncbi:hypothetical protein [Pseudomonas benzenivorans]|uniref:Uncharacterized protein n=1 Tax=Pseudomonas benzenivorans TaxID=556533 RepID=A0ABY5H4D6_9PSED|nr:hypothetical protein [Pseudomonas benzenivorans]UTW06334.1 hypothetical protein KDW96_14200 [Pseudomonas benzenivorans]